ncbi:MAG: GNAT family N-acetyltransferase [Anaerolineae bacterium]|jgi:predicted acetyltransferase
MSEIRPLSPEDFDAFVRINANAYPGWYSASKEENERTKEQLLKMHQEEPSVTFYGLFREGQLLGGMRFHDFTMNFLGVEISAGGVGGVAVELLHKKEHVAKEMMDYFLRHYRAQGATLTLLYPFRPDFYKKMGFGYGNKMNQYRFKPAALPRGDKAPIRYLGPDDKPALVACYNHYLNQTHGMIYKSEREATRMLKSPRLRVVGYERQGQIRGYLAFSFERGEQALLNDIQVRELVYLDSEALSALLTFLHTQADQIRHVLLETQDEFFYHLLLDPRNASNVLMPSIHHESNTQGVGLMYRVVDVPQIFELLKARDFGGQTCKLKLTIEDNFLPKNAGDTRLWFEGGRLRPAGEQTEDVQVRMEVAEFSSLLVGAVNFRSLYRYGLADVSNPAYIGVVDKIFAVRDKPVCTTPF